MITQDLCAVCAVDVSVVDDALASLRLPSQGGHVWLLFRPAVASAIVGAETAKEVTANAAAADVTLDQPSSTP